MHLRTLQLLQWCDVSMVASVGVAILSKEQVYKSLPARHAMSLQSFDLLQDHDSWYSGMPLSKDRAHHASVRKSQKSQY